MVQVFAIPIFFIVFREALESIIIISVLLSFLRQQLGPERDPVVYKKLRKQVISHRSIPLEILTNSRYGSAQVLGWLSALSSAVA